MRNPLISIVIPTYNSENTVSASLESILNQTYRNYEVLVIDGRSIDRTMEIVMAYSSRISSLKWISETDNGIYDAMNKGVGLARGEWLYFLGSDDTLYDSHVLENIFTIPLPKDTILIYGRAHIIPDDFITSINFSFERLMKYNICHQAIFYSRNVFKARQYNIQYKVLSDWDFNLTLFANYPAKSIRCYDVIVCTYSNKGKSASWKDSDEYLKYFSSRRMKIYRYKGICGLAKMRLGLLIKDCKGIVRRLMSDQGR
jgi:glycosyltransferase involved in cell wall biosynthesis